MRKIVLYSIICSFLIFPLSAQDKGKSVEQILSEFDKAISIPVLQGAFKVKLISKNGDVREIEAHAYQKYMGKSQINRLFIFDYPPRVRGTSLLVHSYFDGRDNNMWIYLPTVKRVKRIALESSGGGYFMGSDFTYRDLISNDNNDMNFEMLEDKVINGIDSYTIKATGKTEAVTRDMGYSHYVSYYNKENSIMHRREFYDFNGKLLKIYEVKDLYQSGEYYYPSKITMTNVQTEHRSEIEVTEISVDDIPDSKFSTRSLKGN